MISIIAQVMRLFQATFAQEPIRAQHCSIFNGRPILMTQAFPYLIG
jgi:hypothetical protein